LKAIALNSRTRAVLFLLIISVPAILFATKTMRVALAETWGDSGELDKVRRAVALDPVNPKLHYMLGVLYLLGIESTGPAQAVREMRQATALNPRVARYWSGLGQACLAADEPACADQAYQRAAELAPSNPQFAWEAGMAAMVTDDRGAAVSQFRRFVQLQPTRSWEAFEMMQRGFGGLDLDVIWSDLLRNSSGMTPKLAYLDFVAENHRFDLANRYWAEITSTNPKIHLEAAKPYLERLLASGHYGEAANVWRYLIRTGEVPSIPGTDQSRETGNASTVFNGGFEQAPLNAGFDWHYGKQLYLDLDFADVEAHRGSRALRLDFTLPKNLDYEPIYQYVLVVPGQSYVLAAFVRSEAITSDSGPRLHVIDPKCSGCLDVATDSANGTQGWHEVSVQFTAGLETEAVRISIWRPHSRSFPMEISGKAWFDDISLRPSQVARPD
jgi:tetratricopeptide (TPR) repeat protein